MNKTISTFHDAGPSNSNGSQGRRYLAMMVLGLLLAITSALLFGAGPATI